MGTSRLSPEIRAQVDRLLLQLRLVRGALARPVEDALRAVPRHLFIRHFYLRSGKAQRWRKRTVAANEPSTATFRRIYDDDALVTRHRRGEPTSSSSQPAVVVGMLEDLQLTPGLNVLEIGAGTGWNAALMAHIVADSGHVTTIDIQKNVAADARRALRGAGFPSVDVVAGDGSQGYPPNGPYDRIIATVGCSDISPHWLDQLRSGGMVLIPFYTKASANPILRLRKRDGPARGGFTRFSGFMPAQGDMLGRVPPPVAATEFPRETGSRPLPWAHVFAPWFGKGGTTRRLMAFRLFLEAVEDDRVHRMEPAEGRSLQALVWDKGAESACMMLREECRLHGSPTMYKRVTELFHEWTRCGAPDYDDYTVTAVPGGQRIRRREMQWILARGHFSFVVSLPLARRAGD
jgi:protein-L-isoaspartate(D-aspartate) O-methyltransferase